MESVSRVAFFPNNHAHEKLSQFSIALRLGIKGKNLRVNSNFNIQKKKEYVLPFLLCPILLLSITSNTYLNDNSHHWKVQSLSWHRGRPLINLIAHCRDTDKGSSWHWRSIQLIQLVLRVLPIYLSLTPSSRVPLATCKQTLHQIIVQV